MNAEPDVHIHEKEKREKRERIISLPVGKNSKQEKRKEERKKETHMITMRNNNN